MRALIVAVLAAWLNHLLFVRGWHKRFHASPIVPPHELPPFGPDERRALRDWFQSDAGVALIHHMRSAEVDCAVHAVTAKSDDSRDYLAGYAAGFRSAFAHLLTLSTPAPANGATDPDATEAVDGTEAQAS